MPFLRADNEASLAHAKRNLYRWRSLSLILMIVAWLVFTAYVWNAPGSRDGFMAFLRPFANIVVSAVAFGGVLLTHLVGVAVAGILVRLRWPLRAAAPAGLGAGIAFTVAFGWAILAVTRW